MHLVEDFILIALTLCTIIAHSRSSPDHHHNTRSQFSNSTSVEDISGLRPFSHGWANLLRSKPIRIPNTGYDMVFQKAVNQNVDRTLYMNLIHDFMTDTRERSSDSFAPYHCEEKSLHAPSATEWTVHLDKVTTFRFRIPLTALQEAVNSILGKAELYGPASLDTLIQVPGRIGAMTPSYSLRIHVDDSRFTLEVPGNWTTQSSTS